MSDPNIKALTGEGHSGVDARNLQMALNVLGKAEAVLSILNFSQLSDSQFSDYQEKVAKLRDRTNGLHKFFESLIETSKSTIEAVKSTTDKGNFVTPFEAIVLNAARTILDEAKQICPNRPEAQKLLDRMADLREVIERLETLKSNAPLSQGQSNSPRGQSRF